MRFKTLSILGILCFATSMTLSGQVEHDRYKKAADRFFAHYNADNYTGIFEMFSSEMATALPLDKTVQVVTQLKGQLGQYQSRELSGYESTYASYHTQFEKGTMQVNISLDNKQMVNGLFFKPPELAPQSSDESVARNKTPMILPFEGEWFVFWGGDTPEQNYHVTTPAQRGAFDFLIFGEDGRSYEGDGSQNEQFYAFGKNVLSPCDGEVVMAVDGVKDNIPGKMNPLFVTGNTVTIRTDNDEYVLLAHFKKGSVLVKEGDQVSKGQLLGLCGNSGNSSEAHIHFHIMDGEDMMSAQGAKCYFESLKVNSETKSDYSPVKGERVSNL